MTEKTIDNLREQCLELLLNIVPISQIGFIFVTAVVFQRLAEGSGSSALGALSGLGLKNLFAINDGLFWSVGIVLVGACFFLALINTYILKIALRKSFESSRVSDQLLRWISIAAESMKDLDKDDRGPVRDSISVELTRRLKKYHSKRMLCESLFSISAVIFYASIYLIFINHPNLSKIELSYLELIVGSVSTLLCFFCHRNSIRYALSKVVPLQVCLTATTGELAFSIDAD